MALSAIIKRNEFDYIVLPKLPTDPSGPIEGQIYYNTTDKVVKHWNNTKWVDVTVTDSVDSTGGDYTYTFNDGTYDYKIHAYTSSGIFIPNTTMSVDVLIVAGGGGGGCHVPGGGGAGGLIWKQSVGVTPQIYPIVVGAGGYGSYNPGGYGGMPNATRGSDSSAFGLTAKGGGFGGSWDQDTRDNSGGSGGGRNSNKSSTRAGTQPSQPGDSGLYGYGTAGALNAVPLSQNYGGGGGGGAGAAPTNPSTQNIGGNGGAGKDMSSFFGTSVGESGYFAGGGGGGGWGSVSPIGDGGVGGGGNGDCPTGAGTGNSTRRGYGEPTGFDGLPNTGGGGGGAGRTGGESSKGGDGGSGIVLIRYTI